MQSISNLITFPCLKQIVGLIRVSANGGQANIFPKEMIGKYIKYKMFAEVPKKLENQIRINGLYGNLENYMKTEKHIFHTGYIK